MYFLLDTRPASISPEDIDDDIPPAAKGRPKNGAEPSESGDESVGPASEDVSKNESSSEEDLTAMKREMIQRKLMSEVKNLYYQMAFRIVITDISAACLT
jgi:hypothetical protein